MKSFAPHGSRRIGSHHFAYLAIVVIFVASFLFVYPMISKDCVSLKARQYGDLEQYVPNQVVVKFADGVDHA